MRLHDLGERKGTTKANELVEGELLEETQALMQRRKGSLEFEKPVVTGKGKMDDVAILVGRVLAEEPLTLDEHETLRAIEYSLPLPVQEKLAKLRVEQLYRKEEE